MKDLSKPMMIELAMTIGWWVLVFSQLGFVKGYLMIVIMAMECSMIFIIFTQPAHLNEGAMKNCEANIDKKAAVNGEQYLAPHAITGFADEKHYDQLHKLHHVISLLLIIIRRKISW